MGVSVKSACTCTLSKGHFFGIIAYANSYVYAYAYIHYMSSLTWHSSGITVYSCVIAEQKAILNTYLYIHKFELKCKISNPFFSPQCNGRIINAYANAYAEHIRART